MFKDLCSILHVYEMLQDGALSELKTMTIFKKYEKYQNHFLTERMGQTVFGVIFPSLTWKVLFSVLRVTSVSCVLALILSRPASSVARWPENSNSI